MGAEYARSAAVSPAHRPGAERVGRLMERVRSGTIGNSQQGRQHPSSLGSFGLLAVILLTIAYLGWLFPDGFLFGTSGYWAAENEDITQYIAGFNAFIREPWHWPILRISSLNWPDGTLATFVDIIPAYAVVLKLAAGLGWMIENPFGAWVGLCFVLQAVGAWWVLREAKIRSWVALAVLSLLLLMFPALGARLGHISLMSHWLLVFALAIYVRGSRLGRTATALWMVLAFAAFYINIYIFTMVAAILLADALRFRVQTGWAGVMRAVLAPLLVVAASLLVTMLPLPTGSGGREWGFGHYSMNVLSPFSGGRFFVWPNPIAHDGQGEGFNYLGLGLILLVPYALHICRKSDPDFFARHRPLLVVCLAATVYALSNRVYVGQTLILEWQIPGVLDSLVSQFRASGRYFWLVAYGLAVFAVVTVARHLSGRSAAVVLLIVALLQWWDLSPRHTSVKALASQSSKAIVNRDAWDAFLGDRVETINFYPVFRCGNKPAYDTLLPIMRYAAERGLNLSTGYVARASKDCIDPRQGVPGAGDATIAHVFVRDEYPQMLDVARLFGVRADVDCVEIDFAFVCRIRD